ncbi:hypothetical protein Dimus_002735 [Dionaea muscipula]
MAQLYSNYPPFWNSNSEQLSESLSKTLSLKMESSQQLSQKVRKLGFQLHDLDSSSSQSTQSNHDLAATGRTNSQDQCISSESGQEVSCGRGAEQQAKPVLLMGHPDNAFHLAQIDFNYARASVPYPCSDPYLGGLLAAYGPQPMIQPQMVGMTPARVPLPLDNIAEDEPIYVNAKQYHGILRRRQSRAKLEAQNKLIKVRKPYLHESRHRHALNRVRGSGGRFLSTKKLQHGASDSSGDGTHSSSGPSGSGYRQHPQPRGIDTVTGAPMNSSSGLTYLTNGGSVFQQLDHGFSGISAAHIGGGNVLGHGRLMNNPSNQHYAPVVR